MTRLRITEIPDEKPVRVTVYLPADLHRDLVAYAALVSQNGQPVDPARLMPHMIRAFITSDRGFRKLRQGAQRRTPKMQPPAAPENG